MKFNVDDIQAINAAIDQFKDMVEGGSEDEVFKSDKATKLSNVVTKEFD